MVEVAITAIVMAPNILVSQDIALNVLLILVKQRPANRLILVEDILTVNLAFQMHLAMQLNILQAMAIAQSVVLTIIQAGTNYHAWILDVTDRLKFILVVQVPARTAPIIITHPTMRVSLPIVMSLPKSFRYLEHVRLVLTTRCLMNKTIIVLPALALMQLRFFLWMALVQLVQALLTLTTLIETAYQTPVVTEKF